MKLNKAQKRVNRIFDEALSIYGVDDPSSVLEYTNKHIRKEYGFKDKPPPEYLNHIVYLSNQIFNL